MRRPLPAGGGLFLVWMRSVWISDCRHSVRRFRMADWLELHDERGRSAARSVLRDVALGPPYPVFRFPWPLTWGSASMTCLRRSGQRGPASVSGASCTASSCVGPSTTGSPTRPAGVRRSASQPSATTRGRPGGFRGRVDRGCSPVVAEGRSGSVRGLKKPERQRSISPLPMPRLSPQFCVEDNRR